MLGSTIIVMAWTGVYLSRNPRSIQENEPSTNSSIPVYEIASERYNFSTIDTSTVNNERRDKVNEVPFFL